MAVRFEVSEERKSGMDPITKIICPLDFSPGSDNALKRARELARALGAELELVHVYQLSAFSIPEAGMTLDYIEILKKQAQKALDEHSAQLREPGLRVSTRLLEGDPPHVIVKLAQETPGSMLVLGSHGRTGFRRLMLGSVAEQVVRAATVPVLTVKLEE